MRRSLWSCMFHGEAQITGGQRQASAGSVWQSSHIIEYMVHSETSLNSFDILPKAIKKLQCHSSLS
jgi:hypothetical protein